MAPLLLARQKRPLPTVVARYRVLSREIGTEVILAGRRITSVPIPGAAAVTFQTQRSDVGEVAFSSALRDGDDVVRIPETAPVKALEAPFHEDRSPACGMKFPDTPPLGLSIDAAFRADSLVPLEDLLS